MDAVPGRCKAADMEPATRAWVVDVLFGVLLGGIAAAIVAVNVVIYSGIEGGYEATIPEVFRQNAAVGIVVLAILAAGPVAGVVLARRRRSRLDRPREG